jgi:protein-S-isoprenylcysteine O-methyltransferase Ste14
MLMATVVQFKEKKTPLLERFGAYYLNLLGKREFGHHVFDFTDEQLHQKIKRISAKGIILSALSGLVCVWPTVYVDLLKQNEPWRVHYAWTIGVTLISVALEFYLLFIIAIKAVHEVSEMINIHAHKKELLQSGPFEVTNILARAALELPDPEMEILGIDPFEQVSKRNLLILGLLYKVRITVTNFLAKFILRHWLGEMIAGISINYIALPVECFWNGMVIHRVVMEARLRLFGFALSNHLADNMIHDRLVEQLSPEARKGAVRAIANAVVMARNYHPNMIILLLRFQDLLQVSEPDQYDDWGLFLETLRQVDEKEKNFLLNLFTIAIAFDGKISHFEKATVQAAFGNQYDAYQPRLIALIGHLKSGRLHAAAALCKLDFTAD